MKNLLLFVLLPGLALGSSQDLITIAEKSDWKQTGNAKEAERLCHAFQNQFPKMVRCRVYGKTPENRSLHYLSIGDPKAPTVWVQAGIHAGEIDGKDAVFLLLKDLLEEKVKINPLQGLHLIFIPIVNLDGHERRGRWNRPNQIGPEEMGWRTTAQNLNLNRDFMKIDAPEMQSLLKLWHHFDPVLSLDLHVTNGAQFQPEVGLIILPNSNQGLTPLNEAGRLFEDSLLEKMKERKHLALPFYPNFELADVPSSGFARYVSAPRFAHAYWANNNRMGMLVEAHSWKDYGTRIRIHYNTVLSSLEIAQKYALLWKKISIEEDRQKLQDKVVLEYKHTNKSSMIDFPGYEYKIYKSKISGANVIKYDVSKPEVWKLPYFEELEASLIVEVPSLGYLIQPADAQWILPKLKVHGIKYFKWKERSPKVVNVFRATESHFSQQSYEGHQTLSVKGMWKTEEIKLPKDLFFVPIKQAKARLILQLFEPLAQDSFLSWGFFNTAFEKKEYMEDYVAEDVAHEMLNDPKIKEEFESKLNSDAEFTKNPDKRYEFFYRKHPSWDDRFNRYPVFKI